MPLNKVTKPNINPFSICLRDMFEFQITIMHISFFSTVTELIELKFSLIYLQY